MPRTRQLAAAFAVSAALLISTTVSVAAAPNDAVINVPSKNPEADKTANPELARNIELLDRATIVHAFNEGDKFPNAAALRETGNYSNPDPRITTQLIYLDKRDKPTLDPGKARSYTICAYKQGTTGSLIYKWEPGKATFIDNTVTNNDRNIWTATKINKCNAKVENIPPFGLLWNPKMVSIQMTEKTVTNPNNAYEKSNL